MKERRYKVSIDNMVVANNMDLSTATILVKALFNEYYNDHTMRITVEEELEEFDEMYKAMMEAGYEASI